MRDALGIGEHLGQQARVQRVVHELPRDLAPPVTGPQPGEGADGGAELGEDAEVAEPGRVDRVPAQPLVVGQPGVELGEPLEGVAHQDPREVVVEVAPVRELPVGDRGEPARVEHEVARPGVALHEHDRPVAVVGHVGPQPRRRERDDRHAAAGGGVLRVPLGDLVEHVRGDRTGRAELGEVELLRVEAMERGQLVDELRARSRVARRRRRSARTGSRPRTRRIRNAGSSGWTATSSRDPHRGVAERAVHGRLASQAVERARLRAEPGVGPQPELERRTVGQARVDRVPGARRAARAALDGQLVGTGDVDQPRDERGLEVALVHGSIS